MSPQALPLPQGINYALGVVFVVSSCSHSHAYASQVSITIFMGLLDPVHIFCPSGCNLYLSFSLYSVVPFPLAEVFSPGPSF